MELFRTHIGAPRGPSLTTGNYVFSTDGPDQYIGTPVVQDHCTLADATLLCNRMLSIYRSALTFEQVFYEDNSYSSWMAINHRPPTARQLSDLSRAMGIHIPFLSLPYRSPLLDDPALESRLASSFRQAEPLRQVTRHEIEGMPNLRRVANPTTGLSEKLKLLVAEHRK